MKSQILVVSFSALVAASPAAHLLPRQRTGSTANEFVNGGCAQNIFVFSRGSTERGNMVCLSFHVLVLSSNRY
jgi:cutinase